MGNKPMNKQTNQVNIYNGHNLVQKVLQRANTVNIEASRKRWGRTTSNPVASTGTKKTEFGKLRNEE